MKKEEKYVIFEIMDLQADINWLQEEIGKLRDPSFIDILKGLVQREKRQQEAVPDWYYEEIEQRVQRYLSGESKSYTMEEVRQMAREKLKEVSR